MLCFEYLNILASIINFANMLNLSFLMLKIVIKLFMQTKKALHKMISHDSSLQDLMTKQEKRLRKKFDICSSVQKTHLDSRCFWFLYNVTTNIITEKNQEKWLVIDAGASNGWYTKIVSKFLPKATFAMYEPLPEYKEINTEFSKNNKRIHFFSKALGDKDGTVKFNKNINYLGLSSMYDINNDYRHFHKKCNNTETSSFSSQVNKLDSEISSNILFEKFQCIFLKMDVQGGEFDILNGAVGLLKEKIKVVHMELQLVEKYKLKYSFRQLIDFMYEKNFIIFDILGGYKEKNSEVDFFGFEGQLTECEIIFIHKSLRLCETV